MYAAFFGHKDAAVALIVAGAEISATSTNGLTAANIASYGGMSAQYAEAVCKVLLVTAALAHRNSLVSCLCVTVWTPTREKLRAAAMVSCCDRRLRK
jgi:hypothetical protein